MGIFFISIVTPAKFTLQLSMILILSYLFSFSLFARFLLVS